MAMVINLFIAANIKYIRPSKIQAFFNLRELSAAFWRTIIICYYVCCWDHEDSECQILLEHSVVQGISLSNDAWKIAWTSPLIGSKQGCKMKACQKTIVISPLFRHKAFTLLRHYDTADNLNISSGYLIYKSVDISGSLTLK